MKTEQRKEPELRFPEFEGEWKVKTLSDVTHWSSGGTPSKENSDYWNGSIPWISASSMHVDQLFTSELMISKEGLQNGSRLAEEGTVLILVRGSMLYNRVPICVAMVDVSFNQDVKAIKPDSLLFYSYLFYWLKSAEHKLLSMVVGTGIGAGKLETSELRNLKVNLPLIIEQQKIASFLTSIGDKLTKLRRKRELLDIYKRGLMQQLFSQTIRFKQDDGRAFPEWEKKALGELGFFCGGGTPSTLVKEYWKGSIPWISSSDILEESITSINLSRFITEQAIKDSATKLVPANSILIVSRVGIGKLAITKNVVCTSQDFANFTPDNSNVLFLGFLLYFNKNKLIALGQGTSIKGFTNSDLVNLRLNIPVIEEQQKIADCLSSFDAKIDAVAKQIEKLEEFKKGLLQKMFV